jgi:hypothetical protein
MPFSKLNRLSAANLLRICAISGLFLFIVIGGTLIAVTVTGNSIPGRGIESGGGNNFSRMLREYDRQFQSHDAAVERNSRSLDQIEKKALSVDALLSVLKRRHSLAKLYPAYLPEYRKAVRRACAAYPYSESLAAAACAALVQGTAITGETEAELRVLLPLLVNSRYEPLVLCLHILLGDLKSPQKALSAMPDDFSVSYPFANRQAIGTYAVLADVALLKIVKGDSVAQEIRSLLAGYSGLGDTFPDEYGDRALPPSNILRLAAEYFYDFGDPLRAAELFSFIADDAALMRQADALWLAGNDNARNIWTGLANSEIDENRADYRALSLYNLALTAKSEEEAASYLRKLALFSQTRPSQTEADRVGLIRYSRLFDAPEALAILESGKPDALFELERLRRLTEMWETGRIIGVLWQLLERYPDDENLHEWGAWYLNFQRSFEESAILLKTAERRQFPGKWLAISEALAQINEGGADQAEQILLALVSGESPYWQVFANLGRIMEARHTPARALEYYERAAMQARAKDELSRMHFYIARCLKALDRAGDCRRALEYALDLDPGNLKARLELDRLGTF